MLNSATLTAILVNILAAIMKEIVGGMSMDYMTLKEASEKWGVSSRQVNYYCVEGRIPGAVKMAGVWLVPKDADKPIDGRTKQGKALKHETI